MNTTVSLKAFVTAVSLVASLQAIPAVAAQDTGNDMVYLNTALRAVRDGKAQEALEILSSGIVEEVEGETAARHHGIACRAWLEQDNPGEALAHCEKAIAAVTSRSRWKYYNNLGVAAFRLGDDALARDAFHTAVILSGVVVTPRRNLALLEQHSGAPVNREQVSARLVVR